MALGHAPEQVLALVEHGACGHEVAHVGVAAVGVVADDHVAVVNVAVEDPRNLLQHDVHGVRVDRQRVHHADLPVLAVVDRAGEVVRERDDGGPRRPLHDERHLVGDRIEAVENDREGDGVDLGAPVRLSLPSLGARGACRATEGRRAALAIGLCCSCHPLSSRLVGRLQVLAGVNTAITSLGPSITL